MRVGYVNHLCVIYITACLISVSTKFPFTILLNSIQPVIVYVLCNPYFVLKQLIGISVWTLLCLSNTHKETLSSHPLYFLYPLTSLPKIVKPGSSYFCRAAIDSLFLKPCVGPPLFSMINIKREHLLSCTWDRRPERINWCCQVCSEASLTLETTREQRTANTRDR